MGAKYQRFWYRPIIFFYPATLGVSAVFAVALCPSVRLSVYHVRILYPDG